MSVPLTALSIVDAGELIATRKLSPVELTQAYIDRIAALDQDLHAYISVYPEAALAAARQAERELAVGNNRGPLHGVPVAVKDLYQVDGMRRTCGSRIRVPDAAGEATSVRRLKEAGAIVLGLLNLHEFAFGPTGINPLHGTARNPWNPDRVCGGSSSGSGCATAAGLAAATLGTDTGGSIRIPAALCGVVGMKQTFGLASRYGIYPLSHAFDHGGPLARTVADAALMLQVIAGPDPEDPTTWRAPEQDYLGGLEDDIRGLRIGLPGGFFLDQVHEDVAAAVRKAVELMAGLGAKIVELSLPFVREATESWNAIALAEAYTVHEAHIAQRGADLSPDVHARLLLGREVSARAFIEARWQRGYMLREMARVHERVDLIATPTCPVPAVRIGDGAIEIGKQTVEGAQVLGRFTRLAAFTGQPALSLPCGFTLDGLPIGLQLIGRWFEDATVLRVGHAYEQAAQWYKRRPAQAA